MSNTTSRGAFAPTPEQARVLSELIAFAGPASDADAFILTGAAGTGKTSLVQALTAHLQSRDMPFRIAAPTARAAQVIAAKTGMEARTLHSLIYIAEPLPNGPGVSLTLKDIRLDRPVLYIVDEASMISDEMPGSDFFVSAEPVLSDFVRFMRAAHPQNKVLFLGDVYQLPPVGSLTSPALDAEYLRKRLQLRVREAELTQVLRQREGSVILDNAAALRECFRSGRPFRMMECEHLASPEEAVRSYVERFDPLRTDAVTLIAFTNKDVNRLNEQARRKLGLSGAPLSVGEVVTLDANRWSRTGSLFRGETGIVEAVGPVETFAGLRFVATTVLFDPAGRKQRVQALALLDALESEKGSLERKAENLLYSEAMRTNVVFRRSKDPADDPHLSALRLRYGYALTGHKAQGGEWDCVILHPYYRPGDYRWLYTALTRARTELLTWKPGYRPPQPAHHSFTQFLNS